MGKILVTGGAGFIGQRLAEVLCERGHEVRVLDLVATHESVFSNPEFRKAVRVFPGSILDANFVSQAMRGCDTVVHLAARLGVKRTETNPLACLNINIEGTVNILEACVKERVGKIVSASSSEVYGNTPDIPLSETSPLNPVSVYAASKIAGEEYVKAYAARYGMKFSIVRFFNVYGLGQVAEFVLPRFAKRVLDGKPPVIYGDGSQTRAFCNVDDLVEGIIRTIDNPAGDDQIFNIGNPTEPVSMKELAERVISIAGLKLEPIFVKMEESDRSMIREIFKRIPDISKARELLGYEPRVDLGTGIRRVLEHGNIVESWYEPL
ncbi:MAG: SDR family NAD(P)-dependent oxidoreductase [Candidatus Hydrogenedentota bacterium]